MTVTTAIVIIIIIITTITTNRQVPPLTQVWENAHRRRSGG